MTVVSQDMADEYIVRGIALAFLANALFATTDALVKLLSVRYSIFQIIFMEAIFATLPLILAVSRHRPTRLHHPWLVLLRALSAGLGTILGFFAISRLPLAEFYAIAFCAPLLVTVLSIPILGEEVGRHRWGAVLAGFVGILIMIRPGFTVIGAGHLAAFGSLVTLAMTALIMRRLGREESPSVMVSAVMIGLFATSFPGALLTFRMPSLGDFAMVAAAGLVMGTGQFVILRAFAAAPAAIVAPMQYTMMLWAIIYGAVLFGNVVRPAVLIGATIVVASGLYTMHRERRRARQRVTDPKRELVQSGPIDAS